MITSADARAASLNRSSRFSSLPRECWASPKRRRQFSTMMTAPSTIRPKSKAPRLMRLPETLFSTIPVIIRRKDSGITAAVMSAARKLPRRTNRTTITSSAPSARFFSTVDTVASTSSERSYTVLATTPPGSERFTSSKRSATATLTSRAFSPTSMYIVPRTTSRPSFVAAPLRISDPISTSATSAIRMGTPSR